VSKGRHRQVHRHHVLAVLASVVAVVAVVVIAWAGRGDGNGSTSGEEPATTAGSGGTSDSASPSSSASPSTSTSSPSAAITLDTPEATARRLVALRLTGEYAGADPGTLLHVQVRYADRDWVDFPLPTAVDDAGRFTTYVALGRPGLNEVRVIEPLSRDTSNAVEVRVR
jgi:hypothetical protein